MKTIINISWKLLIVLFAITSCEKAIDESLEIVADSRLSLEDVLNDKGKVDGMLAACYYGFPNDRFDIDFWTSYESLTDNAFDDQSGGLTAWRSGLLTPSYSPITVSRKGNNKYLNSAGWWGKYWPAISYCNAFLEIVDKITVSEKELSADSKMIYKDEAIALRAYYHFELISYYGPLPFIDKKVDVNYRGWSELKRPSYQEITDRIIEELDGVIERGNLPLKREAGVRFDMTRIPLGFVYGLKSRVLLYNASPLNNPTGDVAKYKAAADAAKEFLDLNQYSLLPFEETKKMYIEGLGTNLEATEIIWRTTSKLGNICNIAGMNLAAAVPAKSKYDNVKAGETPTQEIVDCYELKTGEMIIQEYDASHANPIFTPEALAAGYDDVNDPYTNRDDRFYRDIAFNGCDFGESYQMGPITVYTYFGAPGTGTYGNTNTGGRRQTYTGYYYKKDRDPQWYGSGTKSSANGRTFHYSIRMRYAEIYLNYAEALCGAGEFDNACNALDVIRLRSNQPSIKDVPGFQAGNLDWLMKRIQNERRVELVLEGHRFFDVRRWELISDKNNNTISGMLVEKNGLSYTHSRYQMPWTWVCHNERYKVLPIPIEEKKHLPNIDQPKAWQ